ncbi:MAG: type II toxin-antitoxin system VapC family toxin [Tannerella sp.]|jgi:predicted nucleic acid-binding protein|nr:type II toxin-antitoxin system VapC family toxin [Tannerella sp.]
MNGAEYLLDTNVLIYIIKGKPSVRFFAMSEVFTLSVISEMELLGKYRIDPAEQRIVMQMLRDSYIIDIDPFIKQKTIEIRQQYNIKLPDAIVAATAIIKGLSLVTADKEFCKIADLDMILIAL